MSFAEVCLSWLCGMEADEATDYIDSSGAAEKRSAWPFSRQRCSKQHVN